MNNLEEALIVREIKNIVDGYANSREKSQLDTQLQTLTLRLASIDQRCENCKLCYKNEKEETPTTFEIVALIRQAEANREISEKKAQELLRKVANTDKAELLKLYRGLTEVF